MSCCCTNEEPEYKYEVRSTIQNEQGQSEETYKYYNTLEEVDHGTKNNENVTITKVKTQFGLDTLKKTITGTGDKFTDETFPPNRASLGSVAGNISWKRVPDLLKNMNPVLFDRKIEPSDVISGHVGDCYLLSALAALAEFPEIIKRIFRGEKENPEGIYKVSLRVDGNVEEVIIDDYIPVQENGFPIFCQPNKKTGEIWVVLLQKALAKVHGSYSNLNEGIPSEIFRTVTYAPSESLVFSEDLQEKEKVWSILNEYTHNHYPFCATTKQSISLDTGLEKSHTYTIIAVEELHEEYKSTRVVKLRNPWRNVDYKGRAATSDHAFWNRIVESPQKAALTSINNNCEYGLFYMLFEDFCTNFNQIHYCNLNNGGKFLSQKLLLGNKASFFDVNIQRNSVFTFELNQSKIEGQTEEQRHEEGICRSAIILLQKVKNGQNLDFKFVNGIMKYNEANTILTEKLEPGSYVVYAKIDSTCISHRLPSSATLNLYSRVLPELLSVPRAKYPTLIRSAFLNHAVNNKRNEFNNGNIWISWQLFYQRGGFAYLAAGNHRESQQAVVISFNEAQFTNLNFKMKKPLKGKGDNQVIRVSPGTEEIIVVRVMNNPNVKTVKFPPKLDIKLEPLYR